MGILQLNHFRNKLKTTLLFGFSLILMSCNKPIDNIDNNLETIVFKVLEYGPLKEYFHFELADRIPLYVNENSVIGNTSNFKQLKNYVFQSKEKIEQNNIDNFITFKKYQKISEDEVFVEVQYTMEGVTANFHFKKRGEWEIDNFSVWENKME